MPDQAPPHAAGGGAAAAAIALASVSKSYRLYGSRRERILDVLGLRVPFLATGKLRDFTALDDVTLSIERGEQVGLIGRNGAGKTTLLKLLTGNFWPTAGTVGVNGSVQALMQMGLGFHPDFTGHENLLHALDYNGLAAAERDAAMADAIAFAELGDHLHQPLRTYSAGMRSRLQFAAATALRPDILIVDEVLGAGDAYFGGKSAARMARLAASGCTLVLVSHAMPQILQFCRRVIWLEAGRIAMDGPALPVVRAYEEFTHHLEDAAEQARVRGEKRSILADDALRSRLLDRVRSRAADSEDEPPDIDTTNVSRWPAEAGPRISRFRLLDHAGTPSRLLQSGAPAAFEMDISAERDGACSLRCAIVVYREDGQVATRLISDYMAIELKASAPRTLRALLPEVQLGEGRYTVSANLYRVLDLSGVEQAAAYETLARFFTFRVRAANRGDPSLYFQPVRWSATGA
ncbi:MAG: ATP-binding cassette domain-containing protein [Alphaproteobacteria bacterium]|nr:ATP-binding cassette domain-containing protein [Alphaproteobacteria bacterium]